MRLPIQNFLIACGLILLAAVPAAFGQGCDCLLSLRTGSAVTTIDGVIDGQWNDASVLDTAADPTCLRPVPDWNHANPNPAVSLVDKNVKVFSKRDATNLYLAFQVPDETKNRQDPGNSGAQLVLGERVIIQIDPNGSRGAQLGSGGTAIQKDYRLEIYHKWNTGGGGAITLPADGIQWFDSSVPPASSPCNTQDWPLTAISTPAGLSAAAHDDGTGYTLEIAIPLAAIGSPVQDIGLAFAIVNDLGFCPANVCDATGSGFPSALPLNNFSGPFLSTDPAGCGPWRVPNNFGTGFFTATPPSVEISHSPVYWESIDVKAMPCAAEISDYLYFPAKPCQIRIVAAVHNTGQANQTRNILFVWADNGPSPAIWRVVALQESVLLGSGTTSVNSGVWNQVPSNLASHPCVRVYILPNSFDPAFDKSKILSIASAADLTQMENVYHVVVGSKCNAQKNLTRQPDGSTCPFNGCNSIGMAAPSLPSLFSISFPGTVYAQNRPPAPIFWNADEQGRFAATHVAVQVRAFGSSPLRTNRRPVYNMLEDLGGTIQLFQTVLLKKNGAAPLVVNVGNPGNFQRTIWLRVDTAVPADFGPFTAQLSPGPYEVGPGQEQSVKGTARPGAPKTNCFGKSSSASGLLLLLGMAWLGRRALSRN